METIHFYTGRNISEPSLRALANKILIPTAIASKSGQQPALRWLGMWFDKMLRLRHHIAERVSKAKGVAQPKLGSNEGWLSCQLASESGDKMCTLLCSLRAGAWYAGKRKPAVTGDRGSTFSNRIGGHIDLVQSAITLAARGVLPVWKTTPITTPIRDSGLPQLRLFQRRLEPSLHHGHEGSTRDIL